MFKPTGFMESTEGGAPRLSTQEVRERRLALARGEQVPLARSQVAVPRVVGVTLPGAGQDGRVRLVDSGDPREAEQEVAWWTFEPGVPLCGWLKSAFLRPKEPGKPWEVGYLIEEDMPIGTLPPMRSGDQGPDSLGIGAGTDRPRVVQAELVGLLWKFNERKALECLREMGEGIYVEITPQFKVDTAAGFDAWRFDVDVDPKKFRADPRQVVPFWNLLNAEVARMERSGGPFAPRK